MIQFKSCVVVHPDSFRSLAVIKMLWVAHVAAPEKYDITVTSAWDGIHMEGSKHYIGKAFDLRTRDFPEKGVDKWAGRIRRYLGEDYYVLLEPTHLHMQYNE